MDLLEGLNDPQQEAVTTTEGRIRVVAGAGSGKTRVIAHRYAFLVGELGIEPANILCTTFTNKAAREMTVRIARMVPAGMTNDFVCTIHGFCVKFLRQEIYRIGYPTTFTILDEEDAKTLAKETMDDLKLNATNTTVQKFIKERVEAAKAQMQTDYVKNYFAPTKPIAEERLADPFVRYLHKQSKLFALDFQDLIYTTLFILETFPEAREKWSAMLNYIMVDEAQDLSGTQWRLIEILAQKNGNLFIVGDPDQAIYEWRGAKPELFVGFKNDTTIILDENYRSTPNILNVANSVISNNKMRVPKELFTRKPAETMVVHHHARSERSEAEWIARKINEALSACSAIPSDFAVLFRASYLSRSIEQAFIRAGIKYTVWGGVRFFERREIKDTLAYLRLIVAGDDISFLRIINVPTRKLGKAFVARLKELAAEEGTPLYNTLMSHLDDKGLDRPTAWEFVAFIEECRLLMKTMRISDFANYVVENSGLKTDIRESADEERLENLNELISSMKIYEEENAERRPTLVEYLQDIALYTNADYRRDTESVKLMTIHQAKGLEFPYVFIAGASEGILPNYRAIRERRNRGEEEERRLMYVAVTRAERGLFITESEGFNGSLRSPKYPSRFIREIKKKWLVVDGDIDPQLWVGTARLAREMAEEIVEGPALSVGNRVNHKYFGDGTVVEVYENDSYLVEFANGRRAIRANFLNRI